MNDSAPGEPEFTSHCGQLPLATCCLFVFAIRATAQFPKWQTCQNGYSPRQWPKGAAGWPTKAATATAAAAH